ncbi:MAG: hypothetical protein GX059_02495 [Clostridiales bacterium]|jgi:hypothetical protein|nr:hypothetical protein [Clostridiales bacterium]
MWHRVMLIWILILKLAILKLSPMDALDMVQKAYAANFTKVYIRNESGDYYYRLDDADYYLVYEYTDETTGNYLIHLYEFIVDDTELGTGHIVTYGWYMVNPYTGEIIPAGTAPTG